MTNTTDHAAASEHCDNTGHLLAKAVSVALEALTIIAECAAEDAARKAFAELEAAEAALELAPKNLSSVGRASLIARAHTARTRADLAQKRELRAIEIAGPLVRRERPADAH
jgi:hypothetical protein